MHRDTEIPPASLILDITFDTPDRLVSTRPSDLPSCIRFYVTDKYGIEHVAKSNGDYVCITGALADLTKLLAEISASVSVEYSTILPLHLSPALEESNELQELTAALTRTGGTVIREEVGAWLYGSLISPAMWRRARRIEQEKEGAEFAAGVSDKENERRAARR